MRTAILFVALCFGALGAGGAYTTYFTFAPAGMTAEAWTKQLQHLGPRIGIPLFVIQPVAALATIASTAMAREDRPAFWFFAMASALLVGAAAVTRIVHIPINNQLNALGSEPLPQNFADLQRRWWRFHIVRSVGLVLGLAALVLGALTRTS